MSLTVRLPRRRIQILISTNGRNEGLLGVARRRRQEGLKRARFRGTPSETPRHAEESLAVRPLRFFRAGTPSLLILSVPNSSFTLISSSRGLLLPQLCIRYMMRTSFSN
jgi:hypothetical protein